MLINDHHHTISVSDNPPFMDITITIFFIIIHARIDYNHRSDSSSLIMIIVIILDPINKNIKD